MGTARVIEDFDELEGEQLNVGTEIQVMQRYDTDYICLDQYEDDGWFRTFFQNTGRLHWLVVGQLPIEVMRREALPPDDSSVPKALTGDDPHVATLIILGPNGR